MMRLSQGQLNLLETCPRKFQHTYLDQLGSLLTAEQQERLTWGSRFHLLMQQRELGLTLIPTSPENEQLQQSVQALIIAAPHLFESNQALFRQSEHRRNLEFHGYLLTVIYDLLILDNQQAQILDWKTYPRPQNRRSLAQNWQTRLYPFVLAETTDYQPDQISMTYWFVQPHKTQDSLPTPQSLTFTYSQSQHNQTRNDLERLLQQLTHWLERDEPFPQINAESPQCSDCHFGGRCQRLEDNKIDKTLKLPDFTEIQEVAL